MIKTLLRAQIGVMLSGFNNKNDKNNKKGLSKLGGIGKGILFTILFIYIFAVFIVLFAGMSLGFHEICFNYENGIVTYVSSFALIAFMMSFVGTVFACEKQLYESRDNDLLLSMPVKPGDIVICRLLSLYIMNLAFSFAVLLPSYIILLIMGGAPSVFVCTAVYILVLALIPLLSLAFTSIFAAIVAFLSRKLPFKNLATVALSLVFLFAYFYFFANMERFLPTMANGISVAASAIPFFSFAGKAAAGDIISFFIFAVINILPFAIVHFILAKSFFAITQMNRGEKRVKYRAKEMSARSPLFALYAKEASKFFTTPAYMLNAGLGTVLQIMLSVLVVIKRDVILSYTEIAGEQFGIPGIIQVLPFAVCMICAVCAIFNFVTAPSISLERNCIWQLKTAPVSARTVLLSKLLFGMSVTAPSTVIFAIVSSISLSLGFGGFMCIIIVNLLFIFSSNSFGLACNLWLPRLDYPSDVHAIKQSASALLATLGSMVIYILPLLISLIVGIGLSSYAASAAIAGCFAGATGAAFCAYDMTVGAKKFEKKIGMS